MKRQFRRYLVSISVVLGVLSPYNASWSCGPSLSTDATMFLLFQHPPSPLDVFYYTEHFLNMAGTYEYSDDNRNCAEWAKISQGQAKQKDIYNIVYNYSADEFLFRYNTNSWGSLADNSFIAWLRANNPAMAYMAFAKKVEFAHIDRSPDKWGSVVPITAGYDSLIDIGLKQCASPLPDFLKQRYAFQAVKLMYYKNYYDHDRDTFTSVNSHVAHDDTALIQSYDTYLKGRKTILADWAMLYYGFSHAKKEQRALYLIKAFDMSESKRVTVYNWLSDHEVDPLLTSQHDPKLLATIYAYKALKSPGRALPLIRQVYALDPHSKYLEVLITREINKTEDWILSPRVLGFDATLREAATGDHGDTTYQYYSAKNLLKDVQYSRELRQFLTDIINSKKVDKNFLKLAVVRLYHIDNDFAGALSYLNAIPKSIEPHLELQRQIEKAVSLMHTEDIENSAVQTKLHDIFITLEKAGLQDKQKNKSDYYYDDLPLQYPLNELYLLLSQQYRRKGDIVKAALLFKRSGLLVNEYFGPNFLFAFDDDTTYYYSNIDYIDKYGSPDDVDAYIQFVNKPGKSDFEKDIIPRRKLNKNYFIDLKGTLLLRQGKFEEALSTISVLPDNFWATTYAFRHHLSKSNITSLGSLLPVETGINKTYPYSSKKEILTDIVSLRKALATEKRDSAIASINFLLANSYFNMTYYGKDWMMYSYGKSSAELNSWGNNWNWPYYSFYPKVSRHSAVYYQCAWATESYKAALKHAGNNKELAAQCLLMLNLCEQYAYTFADIKQSQSTGIYHFADEYKPHYSSHLKQLINRYSKTVVFDRAATECPDIESYLKTL